jgi:hypothetical protein
MQKDPGTAASIAAAIGATLVGGIRLLPSRSRCVLPRKAPCDLTGCWYAPQLLPFPRSSRWAFPVSPTSQLARTYCGQIETL